MKKLLKVSLIIGAVCTGIVLVLNKVGALKKVYDMEVDRERTYLNDLGYNTCSMSSKEVMEEYERLVEDMEGI